MVLYSLSALHVLFTIGPHHNCVVLYSLSALHVLFTTGPHHSCVVLYSLSALHVLFTIGPHHSCVVLYSLSALHVLFTIGLHHSCVGHKGSKGHSTEESTGGSQSSSQCRGFDDRYIVSASGDRTIKVYIYIYVVPILYMCVLCGIPVSLWRTGVTLDKA